MPLPKKESKALNILLEKSIYDKLDQYADNEGKTKTRIVEEILSSYFDKIKNKSR